MAILPGLAFAYAMNSGTVRVHHDDIGLTADAGDRRDVPNETEIEFVVKRGIDCIWCGHEQECVSVGSRLHDSLGSEIAASARPVLGDDRLTNAFR
jgi:hypothetical protein